MRMIKIVLVILGTLAMLNFVRAGANFPLGKILPFCGGRSTSLYDFGGLVLLALTIWGILRMRQSHDSEETKASDENSEDSPETTGSDPNDSEDDEPNP